MVQAFKDAFPGEHLDSDAMPSIRLLSIVRRWFQPGNAITWVPWQLRLSAKQYEEIIQSKATKQIRTEAHLISTAFFDDTPELSVDHLRLSAAWLHRIQTVFRNAISICNGTHLQRLKAFDKKVLDLATSNSVRGRPQIWQELQAESCAPSSYAL